MPVAHLMPMRRHRAARMEIRIDQGTEGSFGPSSSEPRIRIKARATVVSDRIGSLPGRCNDPVDWTDLAWSSGRFAFDDDPCPAPPGAPRRPDPVVISSATFIDKRANILRRARRAPELVGVAAAVGSPRVDAPRRQRQRSCRSAFPSQPGEIRRRDVRRRMARPDYERAFAGVERRSRREDRTSGDPVRDPVALAPPQPTAGKPLAPSGSGVIHDS